MADIRAHGREMLDKIQEIRRLNDERERLLRELEMYAYCMIQGIDPKEVMTFGYDPKKDKRMPPKGSLVSDENSLLEWRRKRPCYNFVRLNDGSCVDLTEPIPVP